jgi:hypothetical protein
MAGLQHYCAIRTDGHFCVNRTPNDTVSSFPRAGQGGGMARMRTGSQMCVSSEEPGSRLSPVPPCKSLSAGLGTAQQSTASLTHSTRKSRRPGKLTGSMTGSCARWPASAWLIWPKADGPTRRRMSPLTEVKRSSARTSPRSRLPFRASVPPSAHPAADS